MAKIQTHRELNVYVRAFDAAMAVFELTKGYPKEETYSLTDQIRRSSRSVCANLAEAWRLRKYEAAFASKLTDCEREAAETQTWIEFAVRCGYLTRDKATGLYAEYNAILATLVGIRTHPETWVIGNERRTQTRR